MSLGPASAPASSRTRSTSLSRPALIRCGCRRWCTRPLVEPFTGMAFALSRTRRLKAGSGISVLPGRHPVLVAKQLATLAGPGARRRVLPVFGLQPGPARRTGAVHRCRDRHGAPRCSTSRCTLLRLLLTAERVTFDGEFFTVSDATVGAAARQAARHLAGRLGAPAALRRVRPARPTAGSARCMTPGEAGEARRGDPGTQRPRSGREVERRPLRDQPGGGAGRHPRPLLASIGRRRPDADPAALVARGWDGARRMIEEYVRAGLSKFVVRPAGPGPFGPFLDGFVRELLPLQN